MRSIVGSIVASVVLCALLSGCSGSDAPAAPSVEIPPTAPATTAPSPTKEPKSEPASDPTPTPPEKVPRTFDRKNFDRTPIDVNPWVPMAPGIQTIMKGYVNIGGRRVPHVRVVTITDVTKQIDGVRAILVLDQDFNGGQLSEQAVDYLAEDVGGNIWYLGSYTEAYEGGQFLNAQDAWLAGVFGAVPGLFFPGDPKPGTPSFYQVQVPGVEESTAEVADVGRRTCVPYKCYSDVVVLLEQGTENKFWAPGVGQILTEPLSGAAQETEELVNIRELSGKALDELSAEALRLDRNASSTVPSVFQGSQQATRGA